MPQYIVGRVLQTMAVLLIMSFLIYCLIGLMPGDPVDLMMSSNPDVSPAAIAHMRAIYGLDQPLLLRYAHWLLAVCQGDFGFSRSHAQQPVLQVIGPALLQTCVLMLISFAISVILAMALGIAAALKPGGVLDGGISLFAFAGMSVPVFWLALLLILVVAVQWHALPASGISDVGDGSVLDRGRHLILPVATLALTNAGQFTRFVRAAMIEALRMDHIRTARAKGAPERRVVLVHALRSAMIPVVTVLALSFGSLFGGALIIETIFAQPGMGKMIFDAIQGNDFNLALTGLLFATLLTLLSNLAADLAYGALDPRIAR